MLGFVTFTGFMTMVRDFSGILMCRFLAGACGSAAYVIPPGMFVDIFDPVGRAIGYQIFATAAFIGGSLGPGISAAMAARGLDWRYTMFLANGIALVLAFVMMSLPETLEAMLLQRRSRRLRSQTGDWNLHCYRDQVSLDLSSHLLKPWKMLVREPVLMVVTIAFTLDYTIQTLTYSEVPRAFTMLRSWGYEDSAWALSITIIGFVIGCVAVVVDTKVRFERKLFHEIPFAPETRLPPMVSD
jgi:MFS family permease